MRLTRTSTYAELEECAARAGCTSVVEFCAEMYELLEDISTARVVTERPRFNPMQTEASIASRLTRILRGY